MGVNLFLTIVLFVFFVLIYHMVEVKLLRKRLSLFFESPADNSRKINKNILFLVVVFLSYFLSIYLFFALFSFYWGQKIYKRFRLSQKNKNFEADLLIALEQLSRLLSAGLPLQNALKIISEGETVFCLELRQSLREVDRGQDLKHIFQKSAETFPVQSYIYFVTILSIQNETGASIKELLEHLYDMLRTKKKMVQKAKALSSEARFSILLIGFLPIGLFLGLFVLSPDYVLSFLQNSASTSIILLAASFWVLGIFWMMRASRLNHG